MAKRTRKTREDKIISGLITAILVVTIVAIGFVIATPKRQAQIDLPSSDEFVSENESTETSSDVSVKEDVSSDDISSKQETSSEPTSVVTPTGVELDADFGRLLLINGKNPLPDDYDTKVREYLVEIDDQYRNNDYVTQIHKDVYPYITAMVAAAQADGVDLQVWSPFRSYAIQEDLFQKQVSRVGGDEEKAATVVARPGTSEHNTGLCADFNMASDAFENTPMFTWMCENAEDYGFILRYPKEKEHITGVIYESWHWRFVGINNAKAINESGLTLEEFIETNKMDPTMDMYGDDSKGDTAEKIVD